MQIKTTKKSLIPSIPYRPPQIIVQIKIIKTIEESPKKLKIKLKTFRSNLLDQPREYNHDKTDKIIKLKQKIDDHQKKI